MATHSSIHAWRIPWTEEPGRRSQWHHKELDMTEQLSTHIPQYKIKSLKFEKKKKQNKRMRKKKNENNIRNQFRVQEVI